MARIAIAGGNGGVGRAFVKALSATKHEVWVLTRDVSFIFVAIPSSHRVEQLTPSNTVSQIFDRRRTIYPSGLLVCDWYRTTSRHLSHIHHNISSEHDRR